MNRTHDPYGLRLRIGMALAALTLVGVGCGAQPLRQSATPLAPSGATPAAEATPATDAGADAAGAQTDVGAPQTTAGANAAALASPADAAVTAGGPSARATAPVAKTETSSSGGKAASRGSSGSTASAPSPSTAGGSASGGPAKGSGAGPESSAGGAPVAPGVPAAPGQKSEIVLGVNGVASGPVGKAVSSSPTGTKAWVASINARGGLNGHPVRAVFTDDGGDPQRGLANVRKLVEQDKVLAMVNWFSPQTLFASVPYLEKAGIPLLQTEAGDPAGDHSDNVFLFSAGADEGFTWSFLLAAQAAGKKKLGVLYCREVNTCSVMASRLKEYVKKTNMELVYSAQVSIAQPDYTAEMLAAKNAGVEMIAVPLDHATVIRVIRSGKRQNYTPTMVGVSSLNNDFFLQQGGADVEGTYLGIPGVPEYSSSPLLKDMRDAIARFVPTGDRGTFTTYSWVAGKALERIAPMLAEPPTPKSVIDALYSLKGENFGGLTPRLTFPHGGHSSVNLCITPIKVEGGKFVPAGAPDTFVCAPGYVAGDPEASKAALS